MADAPSRNSHLPGSPHPISLYPRTSGTTEAAAAATSRSNAASSFSHESSSYAHLSSLLSEDPADPPAAMAAISSSSSLPTSAPSAMNPASTSHGLVPDAEAGDHDSTMNIDTTAAVPSSLSFDTRDSRPALCPGIVGPSGAPRLHLPISRQFDNLPENRERADGFFIPSYLKHSRYIERLVEDKRSKDQAAMPDTEDRLRLGKSSAKRNVFSSGASYDSPRMTPSHRGMSYDIVNHSSDDWSRSFAPLPTKVARHEQTDMEVHADGTEIRYAGPESRNDHDAVAIRSDHPIPPQCGIYYFEIEITKKSPDAVIAIGLSSSKASLARLPGWEQESWAYHSDDGRIFLAELQGQGKKYGPTFGEDDAIGCGINYTTSTIFFTSQGQYLGVAFRDVKNLKLYPTVGMKRHPRAAVKINFGQRPFIFDIDGMMAKEKLSLRKTISNVTPSCLDDKCEDNTELLQKLIEQYLVHNGYTNTAEAFSEEVAREEELLSKHSERKSYEDCTHSKNRQDIRKAILAGDIDTAMSLLHNNYPTVLVHNADLLFRLRCRKFIELVNKLADSYATPSVKQGQGAPVDNLYADAVQMEEVSADPFATPPKNPLSEVLSYGSELQDAYAHEKRNARRRHLDAVFSLMAYPDPRASMHGELLDPSARVPISDDVNSAIYASIGKAPCSALEMLYKQTETLLAQLSDDGSSGSLVNVRRDFLKMP